MSTDLPDERLDWYRRRVAALERLLVCYRADMRASEQLVRDLDLTGQHIASDGTWRESASSVTAEPETRG